MKQFLKNYKIKKVPNFITVFYLKTKKTLILKFKNHTRILNITNVIFIKNKVIFFTSYSLSFKIQLFLIEIEINNLINKLKLFGIGYKVFEIKVLIHKILMIKLGFSHNIYYKFPYFFNVFVCKFTELYLKGFTFYLVKLHLAKIKNLKKVDVYKNKGFNFNFEKYIPKIIKKI